MDSWKFRWDYTLGFASIVVGIVLVTTVRLKVEENQLVNVFGEFGVCIGSLKSA